MLTDAFRNQVEPLGRLAPILRGAMKTLANDANLTFPQAVFLAAAALELHPDVILDLGTGGGGSAVAFALALPSAAVYTFDLAPTWEVASLPLPLGIRARVRDTVKQIVGDLAITDFSRFVGEARRVLVFWDAHGYAIAARILSHLLPLIADKPHFVLCHDMSDNRIRTFKSYEGLRFWRGVDRAAEDPNASYVNLGNVHSRVEQVVPVLDFCWRNDIALHSVDGELHLDPESELRRWPLAAFGLKAAETYFDIAYFTLNETTSRHFPGA